MENFLKLELHLKFFLQLLSTSIFGTKKAMIMATGLRPPAERTKDLKFIAELLEASKIKPVIDRVYPIEQIAEAHTFVDTGRKKGNVVISLNHPK